jgi:uncharacterized SAM-binding protein YcdF (DUF218 family)
MMNRIRISQTPVVQSLLRKKTMIVLLLAGVLVVSLLCRPSLIQTAKFLEMPCTDQPSEVMIIEGGYGLSNYTMNEAIAVYRRGLAGKIVITLHSYDKQPDIFGIDHYENYIAAALDSLRIPKSDYRIFLIEVDEPYTYNAAKALSDSLPNIRSLLVFSDNFHIRRSYLAFKKIFGARGVIVRPYTIPIYLNAYNWWTSINGWRRIIDEYMKLTYYWFKGYI